ncbi:MAG: hypothetical protein N4A47_00205 [Clostridia bacterium]|jgi:cellulose biosynthesis protein BcsQ|nr:hypothetical protein [Clostridia bacterium]
MIAIATGYDMLDKKLNEVLKDSQIVNYREFLQKNPFDIVILSRHLVGNVEMEHLILYLRQKNTRIIYLTEEDAVAEVRMCFRYAIYDLVFDPIDVNKIIEAVDNPKTFADNKRMFLRVNGEVDDEKINFSEMLEKEQEEIERKQQELEERQKQIEEMAEETDKQQQQRVNELREVLEAEILKKQQELETRQKEIEDMQKNAVEAQKKKEEELRKALEDEMNQKEQELAEKEKYLKQLEENVNSHSNLPKEELEKEREIRLALEKELEQRRVEIEEEKTRIDKIKEDAEKVKAEVAAKVEAEYREKLEKEKKELEEAKAASKANEEKIKAELEAEYKDKLEREKRELEEAKKKISDLAKHSSTVSIESETELRNQLQREMQSKQMELEKVQKEYERKQKELEEKQKKLEETRIMREIEQEKVYKVPTDYTKVFAVLSPESTGKTTIAVNLANEFSKANISTVLIDTDFENKDIFFHFNKDYVGCMSNIGDHSRIMDYGQDINENLKVFSEHKDKDVEITKYDLVKLVTTAKKESQVVIIDIGKHLDTDYVNDILEIADNTLIVVDQRVNIMNRLPQKLFKYSKYLNNNVDVIINKYEDLKFLNSKTIKNFFGDIEIDEYATFDIPVTNVFTVSEDNKSILEGLIAREPATDQTDNKVIEDIKKIMNFYYMPQEEESALKKIFDFLNLTKKDNQ